PSNNTYSSAGSFSNLGTHTFSQIATNSDGGSDWVLLLTSNSSGTASIANLAMSCGSNCAFTAGTAGTIGTAGATLSNGSFTGTWSLQTSGMDHAGTTCNNYGSDFSINTSTGGLANNSSAAAQSYPGVCVVATQSGLTNSPYVQALTITGNAATRSE